MGILNVTPDSFSDGGLYAAEDRALERALQMVREGADLIDVGGESTRPGAVPVSEEEESERILPVIRALHEKTDIPVSVDTYKAETARRALAAGADIINDIWGAKKDPEIAAVSAEFGAPIVLTHNRERPVYDSLIRDMIRDLEESIHIALRAGVPEENIILDPGIGFAKSADENLLVMNSLEEFRKLGFPILLGTSRKRFIGQVLGVPPLERDIGTGATTCLGIVKGVNIFRVHNVKLNVQLAKMMDAMLRVGTVGETERFPDAETQG